MGTKSKNFSAGGVKRKKGRYAQFNRLTCETDRTFQNPACNKCHGRGIEGVIHVPIKTGTGKYQKVELVTVDKVCNCVQNRNSIVSPKEMKIKIDERRDQRRATEQAALIELKERVKRRKKEDVDANRPS